MERERQLHLGARTADALVMVIGLTGGGLGGLLLTRDRPVEGVVVWIATFVAGAAMRLLGMLARAVAEMLSQLRATTSRLERRSVGADRDVEGDRPGGWLDDGWSRHH